MNRQTFLSLLGLASLSLPRNAMSYSLKEPETLFFKDDGSIPNSKYPLLVYRNAFTERNGLLINRHNSPFGNSKP